MIFKSGSADMNSLSASTKDDLKKTGKILQDFIISTTKTYPQIQYLLIIEGQASRDGYVLNNQLSYNRALSLFKFWFPDQTNTTLRFFNLPCEVVIAGAGHMEGKPRDNDNAANQRFLIQIMPQSGIIE